MQSHLGQTSFFKMASRVLFFCLFVAVINAVYAAPADGNTSIHAFDCPNQNEYYSECEAAVCYKSCTHLIHSPACPSLVFPCIQPKCLCKEGYLRNEEGVCIPIEKCDEYAAFKKLLDSYNQ